MDRLIGRFRENYRGFWGKYRYFFAVFVLALLCDAASTMHFMLRAGTDAEIHVVIRFFSKSLGPVVGPLVGAIGKILAGIIVTVYFRRWAGYIFVTASLISFWAAWYNIWGFRIYTPIILQWFAW